MQSIFIETKKTLTRLHGSARLIRVFTRRTCQKVRFLTLLLKLFLHATLISYLFMLDWLYVILSKTENIMKTVHSFVT